MILSCCLFCLFISTAFSIKWTMIVSSWKSWTLSFCLSECINSRTDTSRASAKGSSKFISGKPFPRSQRLTALSVTIIFAASSDCVIPFSLRHCAIKVPNFWASILPPPGYYHTITAVIFKSMLRLLCNFNKKSLSIAKKYPKLTSIFLLYNLGFIF